MVSTFVSRSAGAFPTVEELTRFTADHSADKKLQLVNQLLGNDDQYIEQYARNWTTLWTNILIGRAGGGENDRMTNREGLQQSLRRAFQRNIPYDKLVSELISATGVNKPGETGFNGYVNFLAGKLGRERRAGHGQDRADFSRLASPVHPVPQPPVQRVEAKSVLGTERLLPADAGDPANAGTSARDDHRRIGESEFLRRRQSSRRSGCCSMSCATERWKPAYPVFIDG